MILYHDFGYKVNPLIYVTVSLHENDHTSEIRVQASDESDGKRNYEKQFKEYEAVRSALIR